MGASAIRGSRIGSGPMGEAERGESAPRQLITFFCAKSHETTLQFALEAVAPQAWDCPRCGLPASRDSHDLPNIPRNEPYKTHLAYVKERRSDTEAAQILTEALTSLRDRRKKGEVVF